MHRSLADRTSEGMPERRFFSPAMIVVLLFALAAFTVLTGVFARNDVAISNEALALPGAHDSPSFWWFVDAYGEAPMWMLVVAAAFFYFGSFVHARWKSYRPSLWFILCSAIVGPGIMNFGLKFLVHRPRPGVGPVFTPLFRIGPNIHDNSFPSGHTAGAFLLFALVYLVPRSRPVLRAVAGSIFLAWGAVVGLARVVWGAHFPSDVLFGALITLTVEFVLWLAVFRRRCSSSVSGMDRDPGFG
jgi:membrane-associated phospholipid phosphatase